MEATPTRIIDYFSGFKQNLIPLFQRPYTWGEAQWKTLWSDIMSFYGHTAEGTSTHFMGAVVTMPARAVPVGVSKFMVIDGQQRLTTIALLLCAIRDGLASTDDTVRRRIQNHYLTNDGYDGLDAFKLLPTQGDRVAYTQLVQNANSMQPDSPLAKAYKFFVRRLRDLDDDGGALEPRLVLDVVENRLMVVMINLSDNDDPYLIFESLNFKGSPLEQSDLVRNYFLMRFPVNEQQSVYDDLWLPMQGRLASGLTEFMRHFLGAEGEEIRKGDVYTGIKRLASDGGAPTVKLLMTRMEHLSKLYSRIAIPALEPNTKVRSFFERFVRLDFGTAYPLLLALYEDYEDGQFDIDAFLSSLAILDSYIVRRMVVGVPSNSLSGVFISLCKSKPVGANPASWLSNTLSREAKNRRWPTDAEFRESWVSAHLYTSRRACPVILECLEAHFDHHEVVDLSVSSVEHVLPQTITPEWERELGVLADRLHDTWLHTIGNLTLTGYNPELSNRSFEQKRALFAQSHFELNRYFASVTTWDASAIERRAISLFTAAQEIWPRPPVESDKEVLREETGPANFHAACVEIAQHRLGIALTKVSQTRYEAGDRATRLVCAVSAEHNETTTMPYYWFALHRHQLDFLGAAPGQWLCYGCGSVAQTLLIPASVLEPILSKVSVSKGDGREYWHITIVRNGERFVLRLLGAAEGPDLTEFLVRDAILVAP